MKKANFLFVLGILVQNFNMSFQQMRPGSVLRVPSVVDKASLQLVDYAAEHHISAAGFVKNDEGCPVPSLTAALAVGQRGNILLQDVHLINELATLVRERIPERVVYAKGFGAFGTFQLRKDISHLTKADFLNDIGKTTRVLIRFSRASGNNGSPDLIRDERGFAIKFYTIDGIYDMVGNTVGVFPVNDAMRFIDMSRSRKLNPQTHVQDHTMRWDFDLHRPETILHTLLTFSDYGANGRVLSGFGVHAFKFVNKNGAYCFAKFHIISEQPFRWFNATELEIVSGQKPDYGIQDLFNAIANKNFPRWTVKLQVMTQEQANIYPGNPFDVTKPWRVEDYPLTTIGEIVLNENPQNYFVDIEQAAFSAANLVPGIEVNQFDKMFQARLFAYPDAQRYRLGVNYGQLEVNRPKFPVKNYLRDGFMRPIPNGGNSPNYFPNHFHGPTVNGSGLELPFKVDGIVDRVDINDIEASFRLAKIYLYQDLNEEKRRRVADNLGISLAKAISPIRERAILELFARVSEDFGVLVREAMIRALTQSN